MLRAHQLRCAALIGGYARTAEAQALVRSRWAHDLVAPRPVVRTCSPRVVAIEESGYRAGAGSRRPHRPAPVGGAGGPRDRVAGRRPVLVQVPRRGYVPALACARCRTIARCRHCTGPLSLPDRDAAGAVCRWCGRVEPTLRCARAAPTRCARSWSAPGAPPRSWAGRFPGRRSSHPAVTRWCAAVPGGARRSSSRHPAPNRWPRRLRRGPAARRVGPARSPGPARRRGHAAALDGRRRTGPARGDGGVVAVVAESAIPTVQALIRWDPVGHAEAELDSRAEVGLPPAVHIAAIDGAPAAVSALLDTARIARAARTYWAPSSCRPVPAGRRARRPTAR